MIWFEVSSLERGSREALLNRLGEYGLSGAADAECRPGSCLVSSYYGIDPPDRFVYWCDFPTSRHVIDVRDLEV